MKNRPGIDPQELVTALFKCLEAKGWAWEKGRLYSPHRGCSIGGDPPQDWDLRELKESMRKRLDSIIDTPTVNMSPDDRAQLSRDWRDTQQLLAALEEVLSRVG